MWVVEWATCCPPYDVLFGSEPPRHLWQPEKLFVLFRLPLQCPKAA